jgi:hypothetical protein
LPGAPPRSTTQAEIPKTDVKKREVNLNPLLIRGSLLADAHRPASCCDAVRGQKNPSYTTVPPSVCELFLNVHAAFTQFLTADSRHFFDELRITAISDAG